MTLAATATTTVATWVEKKTKKQDKKCNQPWWPSGLRHLQCSNTVGRAEGPRFQSRLGKNYTRFNCYSKYNYMAPCMCNMYLC